MHKDFYMKNNKSNKIKIMGKTESSHYDVIVIVK